MVPPPLRLMILGTKIRSGIDWPVTSRKRPAGATTTRMTIEAVIGGLKVTANLPLLSVVAAPGKGLPSPKGTAFDTHQIWRGGSSILVMLPMASQR